MKRVLIFTYHWPPGAGPGVQRFLKFCKYLRCFDWEPVVITVRDGSYPSYDESLEEDVPDGMKVFRTKSFEPFKLYNILRGKKGKSVPAALIGIKGSTSLFQRFSMFIRANYFIPDARKGWNSFALKKARQVFKDERIDAIITTGPPHSTHLIGMALKKEKNVPWLVDMRDPWTTVFYNKFLPRSEKTEIRDKAMEDAVLGTADYVTTISEGFKKEFGDRAKKIKVLYNGFDEDDIPKPAKGKTDVFFLSYIGNLKPNQNVEALWEAIAELYSEDETFAALFRLRFVGNADPRILKRIKSLGLEKILEVKGYVPHKEATNMMNQSNMLLFIIPDAEDNRGIITGKIFEYLATSSPMLSIGPVEGDAAKIITRVERDGMLDYTHKEAMKKKLSEYFNLWKDDGELYKHSGEKYINYSRKNVTRQLSQVLNEIS